jgi:pilus assembly protein CpaE
MFPLNAVLVGVSEAVAPHVRRELLNYPAELEGEFRTAGDALGALRPTRQTARMLIAQVGAEVDLSEVCRLTHTFPGWPLIALLERPDVEAFRMANRAGAVQIVPVPIERTDFRDALECVAMHTGQAGRGTLVVAVTGATGGCGATTIAINLAYELAAGRGLQTILIELAQQMGMLSTYLDLQPKFVVPQLLRAADRLDVYLVQQAMLKVAEKFDVLAGPQDFSTAATFGPEAVQQLVEYTRRLAQVVVLDVPCTYNDLQFETLSNADRVVLVGQQTIPSVRALRLVRDTLRPEQVSSGLHVVLSHYDPSVPGFNSAELAKVLGVPAVMTVAMDPTSVQAAANQGRPLRLVAPHARSLADINLLATALLGSKAVAPPAVAAVKRPSGIFGRLVNVFKG